MMTEVWVYEDESNPWDGRNIMKIDPEVALDDIEMFLSESSNAILKNEMDKSELMDIETELYEHFYTLVELAKDQHTSTHSSSKISTRIFELNSSMQDLLNLLTDQRKLLGNTSLSTSDSVLSDTFLDINDELVENGYSTQLFDTWIDMASKEEFPGGAYEAIALYTLFQPNHEDFPLNLTKSLTYLKQSGTTSATVLDAVIQLAVYQNETYDNVLRTYAPTNYLARMVLAHRIYTNQTMPLTGDSCEEAVAYYYTCAEESVQDMVDAGGEKDTYKPMIRLSDAWMGKKVDEDIFQVPSHGIEALDYVRTLAFGGDPEAVHRLGEMYFFGDVQAGLEPNPQEAIRHFEQAGAGGIAHSLANLGLMYANGIGVDVNSQRAIEYFQQAAEQGNAFAINGLGYMYWNGQGIDKNVTKAVELFQKAAELGFTDAHQYLGAAYLDGDGIDRNETLAFYHISMAANHSNSKQALFNLGIMYYKGQGTSRSCKNALKSFQKVSWHSNWYQNILFSYDHGYINYKKGDIPRALLHYIIWSSIGISEAACNSGFLLENIESLKFFGISHIPNVLAKKIYSFYYDHETLRKLGNCYRDGWFDACEKNITKAIEYYKLASDLNDSEAIYNIGLIYYKNGNWMDAYDTFLKCYKDIYPNNIPCILFLIVLEIWKWFM